MNLSLQNGDLLKRCQNTFKGNELIWGEMFVMRAEDALAMQIFVCV